MGSVRRVTAEELESMNLSELRAHIDANELDISKSVGGQSKRTKQDLLAEVGPPAATALVPARSPLKWLVPMHTKSPPSCIDHSDVIGSSRADTGRPTADNPAAPGLCAPGQ